MNQFTSNLAMSVTALVVALTSAAALAAEQGVWYGRAGGTVGADRIAQLAAVKGGGSAQTADISNWYGRAGGVVGSERVQQVAAMKIAPVKAYAAEPNKPPRVVYGRDGVPLPFGG